MKSIWKMIQLNRKTTFLLYITIELFAAVILLLNPYATKNFMDEIINKNAEGTLLYIIVLFALFVIGQLCGFCSDLLCGKTEKEVWENIITASAKNFSRYDPKKQVQSSENVNQQLGQSYELIKYFPAYYPVQLVIGFIKEIGIIVILFSMSPLNAVLVLLFIPFFILISNCYGNKLARYGERTVSSMGKCRNYISDLAGLSFTERFRNQSLFIPVENLLEQYKSHKKKQVRAEAVFSNFLSYAFLNLMIVLSMVICGVQVLKGQMTFGSLSAIQLYVSRFWTPIEFFVDFYKEYASSKMIIEDFLNFLSIDGIDYVESQISSICLRDYVSLDGQGNGLHKPIHHEFLSGRINIVKGDNGIGKTSLALAILGLSDRYTGEMVIPEFSRNKDFVYSPANPVYSEFYSTPIAPGSSMGQLKIAQLNKDFAEEKSVYIFDEPTNFLDQDKKGYVRTRLEQLCSSGKIVIVITHDKDVIRESDDIIVMERPCKP